MSLRYILKVQFVHTNYPDILVSDGLNISKPLQ